MLIVFQTYFKFLRRMTRMLKSYNWKYSDVYISVHDGQKKGQHLLLPQDRHTKWHMESFSFRLQVPLLIIIRPIIIYGFYFVGLPSYLCMTDLHWYFVYLQAYQLRFTYFPDFMAGPYKGTIHVIDLLFLFDIDPNLVNQVIDLKVMNSLYTCRRTSWDLHTSQTSWQVPIKAQSMVLTCYFSSTLIQIL